MARLRRHLFAVKIARKLRLYVLVGILRRGGWPGRCWPQPTELVSEPLRVHTAVPACQSLHILLLLRSPAAPRYSLAFVAWPGGRVVAPGCEGG